MRVIGYVRELPGPESGDSTYIQSEKIRRWVTNNGWRLVSVCHDTRAGEATGHRDGYAALLGVVAAGQADLVVLPSLHVLSADTVTQEIMLWELRRTGVAVASTERTDVPILSAPTPARAFMRDVLHKIDRYHRTFGKPAVTEPVAEPPVDVIIRLVESGVEPLSPRSPARAVSA